MGSYNKISSTEITERILLHSQGGSEKPNNGESENLPIVQSGISKGFRPVYVYSNAKTTRKLKQKNSYSQARQDLLILALMDANVDKQMSQSQESRTGPLQPIKTNESKKTNNRYFVDLAANDAMKRSNSLLLEHHGWIGLCIEPNPIYWYRLASYRTCTIVGAVVGGTTNQNGKEVDVKFINGAYGGIVGDDMDNKKKDDKTLEKRNLVSISTVFEETNVPHMIDYFSLDVEGAETLVMKDFPWHSYTFKFMTIERPKDELITMLNSHGYVKVMNVTSWGETLWIHKEATSLTVDEINQIYEDQKNLQCFKCS